MRHIVVINASPKIGDESVSQYLAEMVRSRIDESQTDTTFVNVRQSTKNHKTQEDFAAISQADAVVLVFPLYIYCLPGILMRFLEDYYRFRIAHGKGTAGARVYAIVNCAFPEPAINLEAVRVIRSYCQHVGDHFRFGVLIGGSGMLLGAGDAPFTKKTVSRLEGACSAVAKDILSDDLERLDDVEVAMNCPRRLYLFMGNLSWHTMARKNRLKKSDLYRRPY